MEEDIQERGNDGRLGTFFKTWNKRLEEILEGNALTHIPARLPYISCVKKKQTRVETVELLATTDLWPSRPVQLQQSLTLYYIDKDLNLKALCIKPPTSWTTTRGKRCSWPALSDQLQSTGTNPNLHNVGQHIRYGGTRAAKWMHHPLGAPFPSCHSVIGALISIVMYCICGHVHVCAWLFVSRETAGSLEGGTECVCV